MSTTRARHLIITVLSACALSDGLAQWAPAGLPFRVIEIGNIYFDEQTDALYFCGESSLNNDNDIGDGAIAIYDQGQWDTLGVFRRPQTCVRWRDSLVVAGGFNNINGTPFPGIAAYVNDQWVPFGDLGTAVYRLKVVNEQLFALGPFSDPGDGECGGIARWTGTQWQSMGCLPNMGTYVNDIVHWNGTYYITGAIRPGNAEDPKDIAFWDGSQWAILGPGIQGGWGVGRSLAVYENELYVSGSIPIGAGDLAGGNAGHGIMRWDGQQFHPVGTGFQGTTGDYQHLVGAVEMEVRDGLLWTSGSFSYAGNVPCPGIAYWDGVRWCGLPLGPQPQVNSFKFYHDTLFASCSTYLDGVNVNCAVKFPGSTYSDTCSMPMGVGLPSVGAAGSKGLRAYRDAQGTLNILGLPLGVECSAEVFDAEGRLVHQRQGYAVGDRMQFQLPPLGPGAYIIRLGRHGAVRFLGP